MLISSPRWRVLRRISKPGGPVGPWNGVALFELREVPDVKYRYVVVDNRTVLVDPGTRKIIKVIE